MKQNIIYLITILCLLSSCKRELDGNPDFTSDNPAVVLGNNELLFSKIFQFQNNNTYLWFDIRNEIANFSKPAINLRFVLNPDKDPIDQLQYVRQIDFRGRIYHYNAEKEELIVLNYPLDIATGNTIPADLIFGFSRKQKEGCDLIIDSNQRIQCERTFTLRIKKVEFKEIDFTLPTSVISTYGTRAIELQSVSADLLLTN